MLKDITLGQYFPGTTVAHKLDPRTKILLVVLYIVGLPYFYFALGGAWSVGKTIVSGCLIFLPYDALKILVASRLGSKLYGRL